MNLFSVKFEKGFLFSKIHEKNVNTLGQKDFKIHVASASVFSLSHFWIDNI